MLIDGYDEYEKGTNTDIDNILARESCPDCHLILTSRNNGELHDVRVVVDAEADITGFSAQNIPRYMEQYLGNKTKAEELLTQCKERELTAGLFYPGESGCILAIPILLHMVCFLFLCGMGKTLPRYRTGVYDSLVKNLIKREQNKSDQPTEREDTARTQALLKLGEMAFKGLQESGKKLVFDKVGSEKPGLTRFFHLKNVHTEYLTNSAHTAVERPNTRANARRNASRNSGFSICTS